IQDSLQSVPQFPGTLFAVCSSRIRLGAEMYICDMDKFHTSSPRRSFSARLCLFCNLLPGRMPGRVPFTKKVKRRRGIFLPRPLLCIPHLNDTPPYHSGASDLFLSGLLSARQFLPAFFSEIPLYSSQLLTVLGNGITSRIFAIPVRYITQRSNPSPNPACLVDPYFLRSR